MSKDISKITVASYVKQVILRAFEHKGSDRDALKLLNVKAHQVRHVATSLKCVRGASLNELLSAGTWMSPNSFISHYIQDFSTDELSQLSKIRFVAAGSVM